MKVTIQTIALIAVLTVAATSAHAGYNLAGEVQRLVELGKSAKTEVEADTQFARLNEIAPSDPRVHYTYAMVLIDQHRFAEADRQMKRVTALNGRNLNAWKVRIWLSVVTKDYDNALSTMETLVDRMPAKAASSAAERKCWEFAAFSGQVFGYLEGPANVDTVKLAGYEQSITSSLNDARQAVFNRQRDKVNAQFASARKLINDLRRQAAAGEMEARKLELAKLENERQYAFNEMGKIEDLRTEDRKSKANERNVHASTRGESSGGFGGGSVTRSRDEEELGPFYRIHPRHQNEPNANEFAELDHQYDRYRDFDSRSGFGGGFSARRGLDDSHYTDTNRREEDYDDYLANKERDLNQRQRRISDEQSRLVKRPIIGNSAELKALTAKATALKTYVTLPVSPEREISAVLASY